MDRQFTYSAQVPLETDVLNTNRFAMVGLGYQAKDVMGSGPLVSGFACTPTSPASLNVNVAAGRIYSLQNVDGTAYSSLAADTAHQILKQGILADAVALSCPAPATSGFSINYLVEVAYQDSDTGSVVLAYYDSANPSVAFSGPGNSGAAQPTTRQGLAVVQVKAGTAATTGTQTTPAADTGFTGLFVVTVANGQSTITSGNISTLSTAPFLGAPLDVNAMRVTRNSSGGITEIDFGNATDSPNFKFLGTELMVSAKSGSASTLSLQGNGASFGTNDFILQSNTANNARVKNNANGQLILGTNGTDLLFISATGMGFNGTSPVAKPTITGSKASNAALTSLLTALGSMGLLTDSST